MSKPRKFLPPPPAPIVFDERLRFTIPETSQLLKQSVPQTYLDLKAGKLHAFKDGRRTYINGSEIARRSRPAG
jgi:hypothetical protein